VQVNDGGQPVYALNELEWIEGEVWANIWLTDCIARIDPASGSVKCGFLPRSQSTCWERFGPAMQTKRELAAGHATVSSDNLLILGGRTCRGWVMMSGLTNNLKAQNIAQTYPMDVLNGECPPHALPACLSTAYIASSNIHACAQRPM
jgi:glutamine cyclotransferase